MTTRPRRLVHPPRERERGMPRPRHGMGRGSPAAYLQKPLLFRVRPATLCAAEKDGEEDDAAPALRTTGWYRTSDVLRVANLVGCW